MLIDYHHAYIFSLAAKGLLEFITSKPSFTVSLALSNASANSSIISCDHLSIKYGRVVDFPAITYLL